MAFDAALRNDAQSEPSTTVRMTDAVTARAGSGLCAEPHAHTAPEMMPKSGGSKVKGRASFTYDFTRGPIVHCGRTRARTRLSVPNSIEWHASHSSTTRRKMTASRRRHQTI